MGWRINRWVDIGNPPWMRKNFIVNLQIGGASDNASVTIGERRHALGISLDYINSTMSLQELYHRKYKVDFSIFGPLLGDLA